MEVAGVLVLGDIEPIVFAADAATPTLFEGEGLAEWNRLPVGSKKDGRSGRCTVCQFRGTEDDALLEAIAAQRAIIVTVDVELVGIVDDQCHGIARAYLHGHGLEDGEALRRLQRCTLLGGAGVDLLDEVQQDALAVGTALLLMEKGIEQVAVEDGAFMDQRPLSTGGVGANEGVAVVYLHITNGRLTDVRERTCHLQWGGEQPLCRRAGISAIR